MILLELINISLYLNKMRVLRELNLRVHEEEVVGIVGAPEAGKSILFDVISGLYKATSGNILFEGKDIKNLNMEALSKVGIARTLREAFVYENISVRDNIKLGCYNFLRYNVLDVLCRNKKYLEEEKNVAEIIKSLLDIFDLREQENNLAKSLAYEDRCKLNTARTFAMMPKLLLLDRPTRNMNIMQAENFINVLNIVRKKFRCAIIIIESDINLLINICNKIFVMEYGTVIASGTPVEIKNNQILMSVCAGE